MGVRPHSAFSQWKARPPSAFSEWGVRPPSAFSPSGKLAHLRRSRSGELAFGSRVGISPSVRSGGENRELAAECGKVARGDPSMMRLGGISFRGAVRRKPRELPRGLLTEKTGKAKVASSHFDLKVNPQDPTTLRS